ncbi:RagB/SusD family nutrient uptake outer membrane protein [Chryseobacterium sp. 22543]|uniref:RagB/SusD family nutrient uptake outer membrane protein n=1 Tax=Chryseobacterium sp. 22543 TaxID=3453940 RepID=UPI003F83F099
MLKYTQYAIISISFLMAGCTKSDFLSKKPNTGIVVPSTLDDFTQLLDYQDVMIYNTPALGTLSSDEYYYPNLAALNATYTKTEKNCYTWNKDIYGGDINIADWNTPYQAIFYTNVVLEGWDKLSSDDKQSENGKFVRAWALFDRAYNLFNLTQTFGATYDKTSADKDLGVPIKISSDVNDIQQRATVEQTYDRILNDLSEALPLFSNIIQSKNPNRPSKAAAYALEARVYLSMHNYKDALNSINNSMAIYNTLIDYNTIDIKDQAPFSLINPEVLYSSISNLSYSAVTVGTGATTMDPEFIQLYEKNDLRRYIYFKVDNDTYFMKSGYNGTGVFPFTGLAVDENYLIKSECQVRSGDLPGSLTSLNTLLEKRYLKGAFIPYSSNSSQNILEKIILERRKELVWRGLRWADIKRLNKEGANIILKRVIDGTTYTLAPNDPKYVMPIPDDEIALSHIQQNSR